MSAPVVLVVSDEVREQVLGGTACPTCEMNRDVPIADCKRCDGTYRITIDRFSFPYPTQPMRPLVTMLTGKHAAPIEDPYTLVPFRSGDRVVLATQCPACSHIEVGPVTGSPHITMQVLCVWCDDRRVVPFTEPATYVEAEPPKPCHICERNPVLCSQHHPTLNPYGVWLVTVADLRVEVQP